MRKALKLFVVRQSSGAYVKDDEGNVLFFCDKRSAKLVRDELGQGNHTVSFGPDHHKHTGEQT